MSTEVGSRPRDTDISTVRVAVLDDYQDVATEFGAWDQLPALAQVTVFRDHVADQDSLVDRLLEFHVVVAMRERTPFSRALLERLPNLQLLITTGPANVSIDVGAARELGITVSGTGGELRQTAELTWALILGLVRNIAVEDAAVRNGHWQVTVGGDIGGSTLGIIGLGRLGQMVARVALAFDMNVIAWSQNLDPAKASGLDVEPVAKDDLLRMADIITIHTRLSDRTNGLISSREFELMKPTAYLINTSRGPIVEEPALVRALETGQIAGAGLEVFDTEPLPLDHPLRHMPNTLLTPHIGYVTKRTYATFYHDIIEDIVAFLNGHPIRVLEG